MGSQLLEESITTDIMDMPTKLMELMPLKYLMPVTEDMVPDITVLMPQYHMPTDMPEPTTDMPDITVMPTKDTDITEDMPVITDMPQDMLDMPVQDTIEYDFFD